MALKNEWFVEARLELEETLDYVRREFGERSGEKLYADVVSRVHLLQTFPDVGHRYKDLFYEGKKVRILHMKKNSIIYCHDDNTVFILAFRNNHRDDSVIADIIESR